ncbi:MAG: MaoC family dehydratase [Patescibacteria group bacterium]|nr:MaoC family dehydratase [Patescibacteria group bacterium]MDE1946240.1 MaoC family dehydratase [Patescibacteria group bacterium]
MKPADLKLEDIKVGDSASFERSFSEADVVTFATLSGDTNPLHTDETYAQATKFGRRIVHGMLVGSLVSRFVGMHIPGKRCLFLSESLSFKHPVFIGDALVVTGTVESVSRATRIVRITITIHKKTGEEAVHGIAEVQVL